MIHRSNVKYQVIDHDFIVNNFWQVALCFCQQIPESAKNLISFSFHYYDYSILLWVDI